MDVLPPPELSSDIQRALQQAVGQANNAFINHQVIDQPRAAKRKQNRDRAITGEGGAAKRKKREAAEAAHAHASSHESFSVSASHQPGARSKRSRMASSESSTRVVPDLGNASESLAPSSPLQPRPPEAFLDAVVSAASATGAPSESPYSFCHPCFDPPSSSSYPYSTIPNDLSLSTPSFQPSDSFSNTNAPDLDYASNDDIIRTLQDLDVTKIASVLKTLGEAAAAANVPLTSLPSTLLQRPQPGTPIDPTPSKSTPVADSPVPRVPQHHRRLGDLRHRELLEHSDHTELLATKWLSANKLAELARTQGQCRGTSQVA